MSSVAVGGTEQEPGPQLKRRRLLDAGGPIEDDETARRKMRDAPVYARGGDERHVEYGQYDGFDPDNVADVKKLWLYVETPHTKHYIRAMGYFAKHGDLPMMRWLYVNGADTRDEDVEFKFPMWNAAVHGRMETCKWLFAHGAAGDIKRRTSESSPLAYAALTSAVAPSYRNLSRWFILNGALCKDDDSGDLDVEIMKQDLGVDWQRVRERKLLLEWAKDLHGARTSFLLFLSGALSAPKHAYRTHRSSSPVRILSGKSGALELISDYTGIVHGREAKIIRQLTEMLPDLIDD